MRNDLDLDLDDGDAPSQPPARSPRGLRKMRKSAANAMSMHGVFSGRHSGESGRVLFTSAFVSNPKEARRAASRPS